MIQLVRQRPKVSPKPARKRRTPKLSTEQLAMQDRIEFDYYTTWRPWPKYVATRSLRRCTNPMIPAFWFLHEAIGLRWHLPGDLHRRRG